MKNWRDEDLVLHRYDEHPDSAALALDLAADPELRRRFDEIDRALALADRAEVAEPAVGFEAAVWRRLRPALETPAPRPSWRERLFGVPTLRFAALAATLALAIGGAFVAGRISSKVEPAREAAGSLPPKGFDDSERERMLLASVGGHLGASSLLLTELANASSNQGLVADERAWAESLLASNRLFRQAAARSGQRRIVALLDELEPLLTELAHTPDGAPVDALQSQLRDRDLLFKVRVVASRLDAGPVVRPEGASGVRAAPSRSL